MYSSCITLRWRWNKLKYLNKNKKKETLSVSLFPPFRPLMNGFHHTFSESSESGYCEIEFGTYKLLESNSIKGTEFFLFCHFKRCLDDLEFTIFLRKLHHARSSTPTKIENGLKLYAYDLDLTIVQPGISQPHSMSIRLSYWIHLWNANDEINSIWFFFESCFVIFDCNIIYVLNKSDRAE